jgi:general stress protein YciG
MATNDKSSNSNQGGRDQQSGGRQGGQTQQGGQRDQGQQGGQQGARGFAAMDPDRQREIAAEGGRASHEQGTGHEFDSEEAREAGRKSHQNTGGNQSGSRGNNRGGNNER